MNKDEFLDILKVFIYYHDIGKVSFSFQIKKLTKKIQKIELDDILS